MASSKKNYNEVSLKRAYSDIENFKISIRKASKKYKIPRSTLQDKVSGKLPQGIGKVGPDPYLTAVEEKKLAKWCISLTKCGFPIKQNDILDTVQMNIIANGRKTPFKDGRPGKKWYSSFLKRNPKIVNSIRDGRSVCKSKSGLTQHGIDQWYAELMEHLAGMDAEGILEDPTRILNGDEISFNLCPSTEVITGSKRYQNVHNIIENKKDTITCLLVFTASGEIVIPMVVFPHMEPKQDIVNSMPSHWLVGLSETGWMKSEIFYEYIVNVVNVWLDEQNVQKPVLLFVDGRKSHITLELSEFCESHDIILYSLPLNATHLMQPANLSVFKPLRSDWKNTLAMWQKLTEDNKGPLTVTNFSQFLDAILKDTSIPESISQAFRKCGLYPFDPQVIDVKKYAKYKFNPIKSRLEFPFLEVRENPFDEAKKIMELISEKLAKRGIDPNIVIEEIESEKIRCQLPPEEDSNSDQEYLIGNEIKTEDVEMSSEDTSDEEFQESLSEDDVTPEVLDQEEWNQMNERILPSTSSTKWRDDKHYKINKQFSKGAKMKYEQLRRTIAVEHIENADVKKILKTCASCLNVIKEDEQMQCLGCNNCPRVFHVQCTMFLNHPTEIMNDFIIICENCSSGK